MNALIVILITAAALFVLYLLSIRPYTKRREVLAPFESCPVAHRGLFDNRGIPENSLSAFRRAVEYGFPVELDVQLTTDDRLVVFHDATLARMCGDKRKIFEVSYDELCGLRLLGTDERIPLFEEALEVIGGRVPLVMEIKPDGRFLQTAEHASRMLKNYKGAVCLESFHPMVLAWYKKNDPAIPRGLLSTNCFREAGGQPGIVKFLLTNLMLNFVAAPDFISFNHRFKNLFSYRLCRALYHPVNAAWTIRSREELDEAAKTFSIIIFDSFMPERSKDQEVKS